MMSLTFKMEKKRIIAVGFSLVFMTAIVVAAYIGRKADSTVSETRQSISENTNDERIKFLNAFGWQTANEPCTITDVLIPAEFDDTYSEYNELQKSQGYDLSEYKSTLVKKYTYEILNFPSVKDGEIVYANLLIYQNEIIGGDISSARLDGFMQGFDMP